MTPVYNYCECVNEAWYPLEDDHPEAQRIYREQLRNKAIEEAAQKVMEAREPQPAGSRPFGISSKEFSQALNELGIALQDPGKEN